MKVYLDDIRAAPDGWILVRWPDEAIDLLKTGNVTHISLDHDLGDDTHGTGYDVILWIEEAIATYNFMPPDITVHSSNWSARQKMQLGIRQIMKLASMNEIHKNKSILIKEVHTNEPALILKSIHAFITANINARIDNILTRIRLIEGVSTTSQLAAVKKPDVMHRLIEVLIKFHSDSLNDIEYVSKLIDNIKSVKNVYSVNAKLVDDMTLDKLLNKKRTVTAIQNR